MNNFKTSKAARFESYRLRAAAVNSTINTIPAGVKMVDVQGVVNDANDWVTLPNLANVENGFEIVILCNAGANFELRTPTSSNEKINGQDSDGTKEMLCTDTQVVKVIKISNSVGWMSYPYTAIGAAATAVVPD